jgi:hypothetical protein
VLHDGSITDYDSRLYGFDIGTCLEVTDLTSWTFSIVFLFGFSAQGVPSKHETLCN